MVLLETVAPRIPRRWAARLTRLLGRMFYACDRRGRTISLANLEAAFGKQYSPSQRDAIARESYCNFARTMFDLFSARNLSAANYQRHLKIENLSVLHELQNRGESAVIICIHHGNFEWAGLAMGFAGYPLMIVAETFKNSALGELFRRCREVSGNHLIAQETSMLRLFKQVRKGKCVGLLVDLNLRPHEAATVIEGFGMKMCVTLLHAVLAQRAGARLVPIEGCPQPDGSTRVLVHPPLELPAAATLQQIAQQCWDFFEPSIRAHPEQWLWTYRHWRYRPDATPRPYPFYATSDPDFQGLLEKTESSPSKSAKRAA